LATCDEVRIRLPTQILVGITFGWPSWITLAGTLWRPRWWKHSSLQTNTATASGS